MVAVTVVGSVALVGIAVAWALNERCPTCGYPRAKRTGSSRERKRWAAACGHLWLDDFTAPADLDVTLCDDECECRRCGARYERLRLRLD